MTVSERIRSVSFEQLTPSVQAEHLSAPVRHLAVTQVGDQFALAPSVVVETSLDQALVPKLGIKSWRERGTLGVLPAGADLRAAIRVLLGAPSPQQLAMARAWSGCELPLLLHLSPYVDLSETSEARFLVDSRRGAQWVSSCLRGARDRSRGIPIRKMADYALALKDELVGDTWLIDVAHAPDGALKVVEINPAISPAALRIFLAGADGRPSL